MLKNSLLKNIIGKDETVLWNRKPYMKCFLLETIFNPLLPFALIWGLIDFSILAALIVNGSKELGNVEFYPIMSFFAFHLMPVWIYLLGIIFSYVRYKNTEFAITDKGVYRTDGVLELKYEHKPFTILSYVNVNRGPIDRLLGVGDVVLSPNNEGTGGITLCDIPDYNHIYKMVKKLQTDIYADTMYPNDLRPKENHGYNTKYIQPEDMKTEDE